MKDVYLIVDTAVFSTVDGVCVRLLPTGGARAEKNMSRMWRDLEKQLNIKREREEIKV